MNNKFLPIQDGTTSVFLDTKLLSSAAGLVLTGADNTVHPISDQFSVGFDITETSDFSFKKKNKSISVRGDINHTGTVTFESDLGHITVGDFTIGFDRHRQTTNATGLFVQNTVDGTVPEGTILFDLGHPQSLNADQDGFNASQADLLLSPEFAHILTSTELADNDLTGADVGDAAINSTIADLEPSQAIVRDGTTSVALDTELLSTAAGLTLTSSSKTVHPTSDEFTVGFDITKASDLVFSDENGFTPISGEIEHKGTVTFESVIGHITVGDFTIGYDAARITDDISGFFVQNTARGAVDNVILFDVGIPESIDVVDGELEISNADLLVSSEFSHALLSTGLTHTSLTGADVGDVTIEAISDLLTKASSASMTMT